MNESELIRVARRAYEHPLSNFYATRADSSRFTHWSDIPFVTREDIARTPWRDRLFAPENEVDLIRVTSGTSGRGVLIIPRAFGREDQTDPLQRALYERNNISRLATYSGAHLRYAFTYFTNFGVRSIQLDVSDPEQSAAVAVAFKPDMLAGFVYAIEALLADVRIDDSFRNGVRAVQLFGEKPSLSEWEHIRTSFPRAEIVSEYASIEAQTALGVGCADSIAAGLEWIHPFDMYVHMEVIDPDTKEILTEVGQSGELVITTLKDSALPLIRYRTGDRVTIVHYEGCTCGRPTYSVDGRLDRDRVRIEGGEIQLREIERVLSGLREFVDQRMYEVLFESRKGLDTPQPRLILALTFDSSRITMADLRDRLASQIKISPQSTYADGVASGTLAALEVRVFSGDPLQKKKGIQMV